MLRKPNGFSLLEIIIALGIFAVAVGAFMSRAELAARISSEDDALIQGVMLAQNKMVDLEREINDDIARGKFPDEESKAGTFDSPYESYQWEYTIKKVELPIAPEETQGEVAQYAAAIKNVMEDLSKAVRELKLVVTWGEAEEGEEKPNVSLTTHLMNMQ